MKIIRIRNLKYTIEDKEDFKNVIRYLIITKHSSYQVYMSISSLHYKYWNLCCFLCYNNFNYFVWYSTQLLTIYHYGNMLLVQGSFAFNI